MIAEKLVSNTISWCAGLPESEIRPMTESEIIVLGSEVTGFYRKIAVVLCLIPVILLFCVVIYQILPDNIQVVQNFLLAIAIMVIALIIPLEIVFIRDCLVRSKGLKADLRSGEIRRFEGELKCIDPADETQKYLLIRSFLRPDIEALQELELLSSTLRIHSVNGQHLRWWKAASVEQTAIRPEIANIASQWLDPVSETSDGTLYAGKRELSVDELEELRKKQNGMWRKNTIPAVFFSLWVLAAIIGWHYSATPLSVGIRIRMIIFGIVALTNDIVFAINAISAHKVYQDRMLESVIIVRRPLSAEEKLPGTTYNSDFREYEFLPISRLLWTEEGQPASWRKLRL